MLQDGWLLDRPTVERYFAAVEAAYNQNPYHNNTHAADVTQTAAVIMRYTHEFLAAACREPERADGDAGSCSDCSCGSSRGVGAQAQRREAQPGQQQQQQQREQQREHVPQQPGSGGSGAEEEPGLSRLERFCIIFASAVHDLGHPGVNNDFLIRTRDKQAVIYNDRWAPAAAAAAAAFRRARRTHVPAAGRRVACATAYGRRGPVRTCENAALHAPRAPAPQERQREHALRARV